MAELLASKVVVFEEEPRVRAIPAAPTSVAGAVGVTQRGPIDTPVLCLSFEDFQRTFGGFTQDSDLALAAMGFFENGGSRLWVVRTVHHTSPSGHAALQASGVLTRPGGATPARVAGSAAPPFYLHPGAKLVVSVNDGPDAEAVFEAGAANVNTGVGEPFALADGMSLRVRIDGEEGPREQNVLFFEAQFADITQATAAEVTAAINGGLRGGWALIDGLAGDHVRVWSDRQGTGSKLQFLAGGANDVLQFPTNEVVGTGNVADIRAVTVEEFETIVESAIAGLHVEVASEDRPELVTDTTGPDASLQVREASDAAFGFDTNPHSGSSTAPQDLVSLAGKDYGAYANLLEVHVLDASSRDDDEFNLAVVQDGVYRESFPNLSMDPDVERYVERVVNDDRSGSRLIRVTDALIADHPRPPNQTADLAGGDDGLYGLDDADFIGGAADDGLTGLGTLWAVQDLSLLMVPGRGTPAVHDAMLSFCEHTRQGEVFAVLDPPRNAAGPTGVVEYVASTAQLLGASEYGALYWPWVKVLNPSKSVFGSREQIEAPPSGVVCGVYARTDAARPGGVYDSPAGIEKGRLVGVLGFADESVLIEPVRDWVYPKRVNPLTTGPGLPRFIDGSRTLKANGNFPYVGERRGVIFIERSLKQGLQFARHQNNTESLRAAVRRTITMFLLQQMNLGAFRSRDPETAFFVDVSDELNPPSEVFAGRLHARVGLATNKPAEWVIIAISQDTRALEAELAGAGA
jgi:hypothetical protein